MVELLNQALEKMLDGPDYFRCEQLNMKLAKKRCIQRQEDGRWDCRACQQGEKIKMNHENTKEGKHEGKKEMGHTVNEEGMVVEASEENMEHEVQMCTRCRERPAMLRKDGKRLNGVCGVCMSEIMVGAKKKKAEGKGEPAICLVDGCDDDATLRGLCRKDYLRWYRGALPGFEPHTKGRGEAVKLRAFSVAEAMEDREGEKRGNGGKEPAFDPWKVVDILREYEGMRERLMSAAKDQIRTPEAQVVWYVERGLRLDDMKERASSVAEAM